jgi:hypothetical protein
MTTKNNNTNEIKFDYAKFAEEHGDLVTFLKADVDDKNIPYILLRAEKGTWKVRYHADMQYGPLMKKSMKVIIDKDPAGWVLCYPNEITHPRAQQKETVELPEFLKARAKAIRG